MSLFLVCFPTQSILNVMQVWWHMLERKTVLSHAQKCPAQSFPKGTACLLFQIVLVLSFVLFCFLSQVPFRGTWKNTSCVPREYKKNYFNRHGIMAFKSRRQLHSINTRLIWGKDGLLSKSHCGMSFCLWKMKSSNWKIPAILCSLMFLHRLFWM